MFVEEWNFLPLFPFMCKQCSEVICRVHVGNVSNLKPIKLKCIAGRSSPDTAYWKGRTGDGLGGGASGRRH